MAAEIVGLDGLRQQLASVARDIESATTAALDDVGSRVAADAQSGAPRGETGNLAGSVRFEKVNAEEVAVTAGDDQVDYAGYVEYGTSKTPAEPFMRPAAQGGANKLRAAVSSAVRSKVG